MKKYFLTLFGLFFFIENSEGQQVINLKSAPTPEEMIYTTPERQYFSQLWQTEVVTNVSQPTLTVYSPDPSVANGTALIIAPGGGFHALSINSEGIDVAKWCTEHGIAAFVLKYRLVPTGEDGTREFMEKVTNRENMDRTMAPAIGLAKADGLAAIAYVRSHAAEYGIKSNRIGIMGFSAGGTVAGAAAFEYTSELDRPDFSAPIYPAMHVVNTSKMPEKPMPLFIAVSSDDFFGFQSQCTKLYDQWNAAGKPIEMHMYEKGGHGFGMRKQALPSDDWINVFGRWLESRSSF